jgi:hypothetical protein
VMIVAIDRGPSRMASGPHKLGRIPGCTDQACDVMISLANPEPSTRHQTDLPRQCRHVRY